MVQLLQETGARVWASACEGIARDLHDGVAEGAVLLQKPLSLGDLLSKVDEVLHIRNLVGDR